MPFLLIGAPNEHIRHHLTCRQTVAPTAVEGHLRSILKPAPENDYYAKSRGVARRQWEACSTTRTAEKEGGQRRLLSTGNGVHRSNETLTPCVT